MGSRWLGIVVDAHDPARLARWWAEVLGWHITSERPDLVTIAGVVAGGPDAGPGITFVPTPVPGAGRNRAGGNRLQIDLAPDDRAAEIERLIDMGARNVDTGQPDDAPWVVLADPEGNEFSLSRDAHGTG